MENDHFNTVKVHISARVGSFTLIKLLLQKMTLMLPYCTCVVLCLLILPFV